MPNEAEERGIELPLPFSQFVSFGSTSSVVNLNLKFDAWVLPFLNVYLLAAYVSMHLLAGVA